MADTRAADVIRWCRSLAACSDDPSCTTRTYLSPAMSQVHERLESWMTRIGLRVHVDAVGNLRGLRSAGSSPGAPRLIVGSHLDTVPDAGAFDGVLGVVLGIALVEMLGPTRLPFDIEIVGFAEEEGVRFGAPFIGSRALAGTIDAELLERRDSAGITVRQAIAQGGLDLEQLQSARIAASTIGYLEFHIEQGPVLEAAGLPVGIVDAIAGQSRATMRFEGHAAHAGTTPMSSRHDALAAAAAWILDVEREARATRDLVATVGRLIVEPNASNVVPSTAVASLDVRHPSDEVRRDALERLTAHAEAIALSRRVTSALTPVLDQPAVPMDRHLTSLLEQSVSGAGVRPLPLVSGAGHDAMVLAAVTPAAMLFLRSPGGVSHHPAETVLEDDVSVALDAGRRFIDLLAQEHA